MTTDDKQRRRSGHAVAMIRAITCVLLLAQPAMAFNHCSGSTIGTSAARTLVVNHSRQSPALMSRLRYANVDDMDDGDNRSQKKGGEASGTTGSTKWWRRGILASTDELSNTANLPQSPTAKPMTTATAVAAKGTGSGTPSIKPDEQETVDEYLEFLDRRYRRLHSDDETFSALNSNHKEASSRSQRTLPTSQTSGPEQSTKQQSFPVLTWLLKGNPNPEKVVLSQQQQQDSLYVLGVAGLASQKLLQKHQSRVVHRVSSIQLRADALASSSGSAPLAANDVMVDTSASVVVDEEEDDESTVATLLVKRVLVPFVRVLYIIQRRKVAIQQAVLTPIRNVVAHVWKDKIQRNILRPSAALQSLLEVGGGKRTIMITLALLYSIGLFLQPLLQTIITEAGY